MSRRGVAGDSGFTLVELLVTMSIFSLISIGFYTVMFSGTRASDTTKDIVEVAEEARLGLNRLTRDVREADEFVEPPPAFVATAVSPDLGSNGFHILVNFNNDFTDPDGNPATDDGEPIYTNTPGNIEDIIYHYDDVTDTIRLFDGTTDEILVEGVTPLLDAGGAPLPIFSFYSNLLEFDAAPEDGVVTWVELDAAQANVGVAEVGNMNGVLDDGEWQYVSRMLMQFNVEAQGGAAITPFVGQAQLRNFRFQTGA